MAWRKPANLHEWMGIIVRHKKKFFFPAIITATVVIWASQYMPRSYRAEAKYQRKSDTTTEISQDTLVKKNYERIRSLMQYDFKGRPAITRLINDVNALHEDLPMTDDNAYTDDGKIQYEARIKKLMRGINVRTDVSNDAVDLVTVSYTDDDPDLVKEVVNTLIETYLKKVQTGHFYIQTNTHS